jgi:hypothetical protein
MKSSIQVLVTETSVVVLSKGAFMTSIPLRHWITTDGTTWSSRLRRAHELERLISRLTSALQNLGSDSVMKRILRVMAEPPLLHTTDENRRLRAQPVTSSPQTVRHLPVVANNQFLAARIQRQSFKSTSLACSTLGDDWMRCTMPGSDSETK